MRIKKIVIGPLLLIGLLSLSILGTLVYQGQITPRTDGQYVALGSSFSAGLGLGKHASGSPLVCLFEKHKWLPSEAGTNARFFVGGYELLRCYNQACLARWAGFPWSAD